VDLPAELTQDISDFRLLANTQLTLAAKLAAVAELIRRADVGCDWVSIALVVEGTVTTAASTGATAVEVDLVQYRQREGPCLNAVRDRTDVRVDVLGSDERFVHFAPGAIELGVESVVSIPLMAGDAVVGSTNLYSASPQGFEDQAVQKVRPLTDYAAELIAYSPLYAASLQLVDHVATVMAETDTINQSVNVLAGRTGRSTEEAQAELRRLADQGGLSLVEAARTILGSPTPN